MNVKDLMLDWNKESVVDKTKAGSEALRIIGLHSKYYNILIDVTKELRNVRHDINILYRELMEYYRGFDHDSTREVYDLKILKADEKVYINSDPKMIKLLKKEGELEDMQKAVLEILQKIKDIGFQIKSYIEWEKFRNGMA